MTPERAELLLDQFKKIVPNDENPMLVLYLDGDQLNMLSEGVENNHNLIIMLQKALSMLKSSPMLPAKKQKRK